MSVLKVGTIIRERREALNLSQEDLADGVCAVPTLSRIENGTQLPSKNHLEALMERLGLSTVMVESYTDDRSLYIHELRYQVQVHYLDGDFAAGLAVLAQLEQLITDSRSLDWQFVLLYRIMLTRQRMTPQERLARLEEALLLSCPHYKTRGIPMVLSYREISILNMIAGAYEDLGQRQRGIDILQNLRAYYDAHVIVPEEALRTQPMILYNLSKLLGLDGRYDECIEACDQGIRIARRTGRCQRLATTLFNRGWALLRRNREGDRAQAEIALRQACCMMCAMEKQKELLHCREYYEKEFGPLTL